MAYLDELRQLVNGTAQTYSPQYGYNPVLPKIINPEIRYGINPPVLPQPTYPQQTYPYVKSNPILASMRQTQDPWDQPLRPQPTYPRQVPASWGGDVSRPINDTWTGTLERPGLNPINKIKSQYGYYSYGSKPTGYNQYQQETQPSYNGDYEQLQYEREKKRRQLRDRYSQQNMNNYDYYA